MKTAALFITLLFCNACTVESVDATGNTPKEDEQKQDDESRTDGNVDSEKDPALVKNSTKVHVAVDVTVENYEYSADAPEFIYVSQAKEWAQHVAAAPTGYEMISRADAIDLIDSGELEGTMAEGDMIWTSTVDPNQSTNAYLVFGDGDSVINPKVARLRTVYVRVQQ